MKRRYEGRIRPAGESSDEDELLDYMVKFISKHVYDTYDIVFSQKIIVNLK